MGFYSTNNQTFYTADEKIWIHFVYFPKNIIFHDYNFTCLMKQNVNASFLFFLNIFLIILNHIYFETNLKII